MRFFAPTIAAVLGVSLCLVGLIAKDVTAFTVMPGALSSGISKTPHYKNLVQFASTAETGELQTTMAEAEEASETNGDLQICLEKLEKRINEGPGSLSKDEVNEIEAAMARIVEILDSAPSDEPTSTSTSSTAAVAHTYDEAQLRTAAMELNATAVSAMLDAGLEMDEATTDAAFWAVVNAVDDAEANDRALPAAMPQMIHHIFDADMRHLLTREKQTTNVTCMQPDDSTGEEGSARRMNYIFDDSSHKDLPLKEGRVCEGGDCCDACSRNIFPTFAQENEMDMEKFSQMSSLTFNALSDVKTATILQFVRLIERVRRTISHEYGLPLKTLLPLQAYSRKYVAGTTQQGGGGGEGDFVTLHTDESTHSGYHYSCVLYLSTQGKDFEGGNFVFNDPAPQDEIEEVEIPDTLKSDFDSDDDDEADAALFEAFMRGELPEDAPSQMAVPKDDDSIEENSVGYQEALEEGIRRAGRKLRPFHPTRGAAVIFSSGWENMHEVEKITSGVRYAVPAFFTTCPVPEAAYDQMAVGKPKTDEDIADDWLHLLLAHREESPMESAGRVRELLMKWHFMCAPLSDH